MHRLSTLRIDGAEQARHLARLSVLGPLRFAAEQVRQLGGLTKLAPCRKRLGLTHGWGVALGFVLTEMSAQCT